LAWLIHAADAGQRDAKALLHLLARADKHDQDVAVFVDSYSKTIAALCRRLEALERGANLRQQDGSAEAAESDSVADTAQRITDYAAKAGLTVQGWVKAFNAAPVDAGPVANALTVAEAALADVAEGEPVSPRADDRLHWAETRCTEALAVIRRVMRQHGIRTSEWPAAAPAPAPATPPAPEPGEVGEVVGQLMAVCATRGFDGWRCDAVRRAATLLQQQEAELATLRGVPVAWCRSDEFANSMNRGGSFSGWKDPGAGANKCDMQLYAIPLPAPVPVAECPHCGYEGEMVPAPQAGDVAVPVPVSERPWEREGWCDAEGRCWLGSPGNRLNDHGWVYRKPCELLHQMFSLPHNAIPLPASQAGEVEASGRRSEGDWVDDLQHAIESKEDDFLGGVCVALALVTAHGEATIWREIVRSVGTDSLLNYAANVNPDDWNLAGFGEYAQSELGKGKPQPAPQAGEVEA
jgi:hypothetical protein